MATLQFCYLPYVADPVEHDGIHILPRWVFRQKVGNCSAQAALFVLESCYRRVRTKATPPHYSWDLSLKDLLDKLERKTFRTEGFDLHFEITPVMEKGIKLYRDVEMMEDDGEDPQIGHKFYFSRFITYYCRHHDGLVEWKDGCRSGPSSVKTFEDICEEIRMNGPVIATMFMDETFYGWNKENATHIYPGACVESLETLTVKEREERHHGLSLIGFGEDLGDKYFIAQNSHGKEWGDEGKCRMAPAAVRDIYVPILRY